MKTFRIDLQKWRAAVKEVEAKREEWPKLVQEVKEGKKTLKEIGYYEPDWAAQLTKLYSIRAHARGRIHRASVKLNASDWYKLGHKTPSYAEFAAANGKLKFSLTLDDQAAYLGDSWKEYERPIVKWEGTEKAPECFCGMPAGVILDEKGHAHLLCIFHTSGEGAMFPLPTERPANWPDITREELNSIMAAGAAEAEKRGDDD